MLKNLKSQRKALKQNQLTSNSSKDSPGSKKKTVINFLMLSLHNNNNEGSSMGPSLRISSKHLTTTILFISSFNSSNAFAKIANKMVERL